MSAPHNPRVTQADADVAQAIVSGVRGYGVTFASPLEHSASVMVARHREAAEAASKARTMSDHGRMLWRDDVEGHCPSPELCFEHGLTVRCSPCAIKQAEAAGVATLHPERTYSPQECRLKRELAEAKAREAALVSLLTDAREQINDASAAVPNDEWRHEMQALVERIDALTKEPGA